MNCKDCSRTAETVLGSMGILVIINITSAKRQFQLHAHGKQPRKKKQLTLHYETLCPWIRSSQVSSLPACLLSQHLHTSCSGHSWKSIKNALRYFTFLTVNVEGFKKQMQSAFSFGQAVQLCFSVCMGESFSHFVHALPLIVPVFISYLFIGKTQRHRESNSLYIYRHKRNHCC